MKAASGPNLMGSSLVPMSTDLSRQDGPDTAARAIMWAGANFPGYYESRGKQHCRPAVLTCSTFEIFCAALQASYAKLCLSNGALGAPPKLRTFSGVEAAVKAVTGNLTAKGAIDCLSDRDPQAWHQGDSYSHEDFLAMSGGLLNQPSRSDARAMAMLLFCHHSVGRGDDVRQLLLSLVCPPVLVRCVRPSMLFVVLFGIDGGKTQKPGSRDYKALGRARNALICGQGAMGRHLMATYTLDGVPFPDPDDKEQW